MKKFLDFSDEYLRGFASGIFVSAILYSYVIPKIEQHAYEKMATGEIQCVFTPDKKIYCYEPQKHKVH